MRLRQDDEYWQRLRKDTRSNAAGIFAYVAIIAASVSVISVMVTGSQYESRTNPLYWLLMLPGAWWVIGLSHFKPRHVRIWKPALGLACLAAGLSLFYESRRYEDWTVVAVTFGITVLASAASLIAYRGSLVAREGPAR